MILSLADPFTFFLLILTHVKGQLIFPFFTLLACISLLKFNKRKALIVIAFTIGITIFIINATVQQIMVLNAGIHIIILAIIFDDFLKYIYDNNAISIFFLILMAYEFSSALKSIIAFTDLIHGIVLFYLTSFFQIFFGVVFSFINVNTKLFTLTRKEIIDK